MDRIYDESLPEDRRKPSCVLACPTGARLFGDVHDDTSEVSQIIRERRWLSIDAKMGHQASQSLLTTTQIKTHHPPR